jgi:protein TonB
MEINNIMNADLLDILFEGKNKEYGAYELRKTYNKRIAIAIAGMAAFCLLFFLTQILASGKDKIKNTITVTDVKLAHLKDKTPQPVQVKPPKAAPQKVATSQYTPPLIVKNTDVTDPPPAMDKLDKTQIGLMNEDGVKDVGFAAPPVEASTGAVEALKKPVEEDYERTFTKVEKEAKFPGGPEAWKRYLERNLNANVAADDGAVMGYYIVRVQFIVDKEGNISNVQAIEVPKACPSCGPEAVKIIKKGPKWEPAIQNDRKVNYKAVQIVTFQVAEE